MSSSAHEHHQNNSFASQPSEPSTTTTRIDSQNPNANPNAGATTVSTLSTIPMCDEDVLFSRATHLTRTEVIRRRSKNLKRLIKCYRHYYWALTEEIRGKHREYYWRYGISPFKEEQIQNQSQQVGGGGGGSVLKRENGSDVRNGEGSDVNVDNKNRRCLFVGCKFKAMALTTFCHLHILSDPKQKLYTASNHIIKSDQAGSITCRKPILKSNVSSLCNGYYQKTQKHVSPTLKKAGPDVSSSSKPAQKLHLIITEYVRAIQSQRRASVKRNEIAVQKEEPS